MPAHASAFPLTRRLIDSYLMFGLACAFACVILVLQVTLRTPTVPIHALAVAIPLLLLLIGAFVLRRTSRVHNAIEAQLRSAAESSDDATAHLQPIKDADPVAEGWNQVLQRLHNQHVMQSLEQRLRTSLGASDGQRWEAVFNSLNEGLALTDASGLIQHANNALLATLGKDEDTVLGRQIDQVLAEFCPASSHLLPADVAMAAGKFNGELRKGEASVDGVWRVTCLPLIQADAVAEGAVWTLRDVTQQRLSEEMRDQFVFTATHELRTPLANIKAYAETLSMDEDIDVERQKGFFNIINAEATRLARFVDELLDVSQMEAGAISVTLHETDIQRVIREAVEHVQPQAQQKSLQFECLLPPKLPKMRVDKDKFAGAIVNLLGNAIKYTPSEGQVRLLVEVEPGQLLIHVEDTGIGIAAEEIERLGEKFFRSQDQRIREIPGSGLGLAFVQEVARLHGGQLNILSELDRGSRFSLSLPLPTGEAG